MGKPTGFMDYERLDAPVLSPAARVQNFDCFHGELTLKQRKEQAGRCMDCGVPFCQAGLMLEGKAIGCPLKNLIPEWNDQLWNGNLEEALERLLHTNCFPEFTGYVCPAPCEHACSCGKIGTAVTINANERHIIEQAFEQGLMKPRPPKRRSGKRVAVVGSGPAGLTVAALLNHRGHSVTVLERDVTPGGLLVYGIPNMKLPKEVVARRIELLKAEGIEFACRVDVGHEVTLDSLVEAYDAVVLAIGAQEPRVVPFEDPDSAAVYVLEYLGASARTLLGEQPELGDHFNAVGKTVAVIGAGNSANDAIATALRQGAADVVQLIRRPAEDYGPMTDYAHVEASAVLGHDIRRFQTQVAAVHTDDAGKLQELVLSTPEGEETLDAQMLVVASGFNGPQAYVTEGCELGEEDGLFSAGDVNLGSTLVVRAMADARKTARKVDCYLMGYSSIR